MLALTFINLFLMWILLLLFGTVQNLYARDSMDSSVLCVCLIAL